MTDKELLEYAAKAAGIDHCANVFGLFFLEEEERYWNPLTDDGDALRLAVMLRLNVDIFLGEIAVNASGCDKLIEKCINDINYNDPYLATRRAIVRAAAEIGKGKK